jgi:hypothetical protein
MDFPSHLISQALPPIRYYSEKYILVKHINDSIYYIDSGELQNFAS